METLNLQAKTRQELALEYGIDVKTLKRWFEKGHFDIPPGKIDPYHLRIIYKTFGIPNNINMS